MYTKASTKHSFRFRFWRRIFGNHALLHISHRKAVEKTDKGSKQTKLVVIMVADELFETRQVSWSVLGLQVHGTLTCPKDGKASCGVVFVAGSGPTDRDWCSPLIPGTNGSGKLLAETLTREGFATLRYDKLGSGPNAIENVTKLIGKISMQSHLDELSGAVETLIKEGQVNENCVFALTNSEGTIHALNYQAQAKKPRFKGLVLTGAPGRAIGAVARSQIHAQIQALPNPEDIMRQYDTAVADFVNGKPVQPAASLPKGIQQLLLSLTNPANLPFARELWTYDPAEHIAKVSEPILVVIGKKDIQTNWESDGKPLEQAAAQNADATFLYPENANHVLKSEETPREQLTAESTLRYNSAEAPLDAQTVDAIVGWLKKQALKQS